MYLMPFNINIWSLLLCIKHLYKFKYKNDVRLYKLQKDFYIAVASNMCTYQDMTTDFNERQMVTTKTAVFNSRLFLNLT